MKKIIFIFLAAAFVFSACEKKTPQFLDPDATVNIREAKATRSADTDDQIPTWAWIVENAGIIHFYNTKHNGDHSLQRGFSDAQRDKENNMLKMWSTDIIGLTSWGERILEPVFIEAVDVTIRCGVDMIVAYIPNATLREAEVKIKAAWAANDYSEVYRLFDKAYTAIPTTTAIYEKLKAEGKN